MKAKEIMAGILDARGLPNIDDLRLISHHECERIMDAVDYPNSCGASATLGGVSSLWMGYLPIGFYLLEENFQDKKPWETRRNVKTIEGAYPNIEFSIEDFSSIEESFQLRTLLEDLGDDVICSIGYYISGTGNTLAVFIRTQYHKIYGIHQCRVSRSDYGWNEGSSNYSDDDIHVIDVE